MGEVIVITSGKGGVGKTTITANVGIALSMLGCSTCLIDADIGLRNLDLVLGIENKVKFNLMDISKGICSIEDAVIYDIRSKKNLCLIAASQAHFKEDLSKEKMAEVILKLKGLYDYVLIDSPAGIEYGFKNSIRNATRALIIVNPEVSSIRDADRVIGILEKEKIRKIELIVNRINLELIKRKDMINLSDIEEILDIPLIGVIPEDNAILISSNSGKPVAYQKDSQISLNFLQIAKRIRGEFIPLISSTEIKSESLWNKVKKTLKI
jgi:septum site-determining protein MinD